VTGSGVSPASDVGGATFETGSDVVQGAAAGAQLLQILAANEKQQIYEFLRQSCSTGTCSMSDLIQFSQLQVDSNEFIPPFKDAFRYGAMTTQEQYAYVEQVVIAYAEARGKTVR
jgi:hypothetical protein